MVMELLGPNLEDLLNFCGRKFSPITVALVALQLLERVEQLHSKSFLHRDIKPDNFVIGTGENADTIYMIDYGLAKRYRDPKTKMHVPYRDGKHMTGTARYASISTHLGIEQSRRDDIEALAYTFIYLLRSELPWQGIRAFSRKEKYDKILEYKVSTHADILCRKLPGIARQRQSDCVDVFKSILSYAKEIKFEEKPNYDHLREALLDFVHESDPYGEPAFDWVVLKVNLWLQDPGLG